MNTGTHGLYYPAFYKLSDTDIHAYLTLLTTHGFLKTASQSEVDEIIRQLTRKRRNFLQRQEDPDKDAYRRTKARYGEHPTPPFVHYHDSRGPYSNRQERYSNPWYNDNGRRPYDNRPAWQTSQDAPTN
jgi:hypothetical protein